MRTFVFSLLCSLTFTALLLGQGTTGSSSVTGQVKDSSGAVIGGADVTLTDTATNISHTTQTNSAGLYIFNNVSSGRYDITVSKAGFSKAAVRAQEVLVGTSTTVNMRLEVGQLSEVVEVKTVAGAELQTLNATMGQTIPSEGLLELPTINRDVSGLLFVQPTAAPTFGGAESNQFSGQIAGNMSDQNTYMLDGGNSTSDLDGDNGTYVQSRSGVVPTPMESVEEVRVNTNNMTADFSLSNGGEMLITTKRGTNQFHGSAYDFFQSDVLAANDWFNNFHDRGKPKAHYNRFGGSFGGPVLPSFLGGKTYIYTNYEGERYPRSGPFEKLVPSDTLRQGILRFRDASGNVISYNLANSTACGANGGQACDPRGIGISPVVNQMWSKYEPSCNDANFGDRLNTCGFISNLAFPLSTNFGVVRVDHDFGAKWRWFSSYRYFRQVNPDTSQVDIGGLLAGDTKGQAASASSKPVNPRFFVTGITGELTANLTNEFHFSYARNQWQWLRPGALPQLAGIAGAVGIGGESTNALIPMNIDTQNARPRLWAGHDYSYRDTLSWLKGTHLFQFGGEFFHQHWKFDRYDNVVGGLTQLVDDVSSSGVHFDSNFRPVACSDAVTTNCLPTAQNGNWANAYSELLGFVDKTSIVVTRTGSNLTANPLGQPIHSFVTDQTYSLYINDSWKIKPNLTLSYGLNYTLQMPPYEQNGAQDVLTNATGQILTANQYFQSTQAAALNGQVYNPVLGFTPVRDISPGNKYVYRPFYGAFAPRVAVAWNPEAKGGWLGKILGDKATVIRAGFGRFYSRSLGIDLVSSPVLGDGFLQPVGCANPNSSGVCTHPGSVDPTNAFRIGVDGLNPPVGAITPTLPIPVTPGFNAPYATLVESLDNTWRPVGSNQVDFSIQRQLKGNTILEVGYVGVWADHLYQGYDLGMTPYMMKQGGQTFAQAYQNIYYSLAANPNGNVAAQPFFETALKGSSYCKGFTNCTAAVVANESGNFLTQAPNSIWSDLDTSWNFGPALPTTNQCFYCYAQTSNAYSNYQALVVTAQKRYSQGLTVNANFTFSHALGVAGLPQSLTLAGASNAFNLYSDYGPQFFDRKFTFNLLGSYQLPFGKGKRWANSSPIATRLFGGWTISPIFTLGSGLPLQIVTGSGQEQGAGALGADASISATAIPISGNASSLGNSPHFGVVSNGTIGVNGDSSQGGSGVNFFTNPAAVYNNFRPFILGVDSRTGAAGILRGFMRYNLDLGITKDTRITERVGFQLFGQAFNVLNHMMWKDPGLNLQDQANFGYVATQFNAQTLGGSLASANYTRIIQVGLRVYF
jgi:hypothetical protein